MLKKLCWLFSLILLVTTGFAQNVPSKDIPPKSTTLVTDFTNTLSADDKQRLESKLVAFDDSTSIQVAVVLIKSVGEYDIDEYGTSLGRAWGIGNSGKNNGVLLLAALNDHKVTIQTGYGVEGALPDITTQQIIQHDIVPHFKQNDFYGGLDSATTDIIKATRGEYKADADYANRGRKKQDDSGGSIGVIIIIVIIVLFFIFRNRGGGGNQVIGGRGGASPFWWFLAGNLLGGGGRSGGSGGGSWGGGGDSGGGGGFGGFGGGSFGGGGSSGSW